MADTFMTPIEAANPKRVFFIVTEIGIEGLS